MHSLVGHRWKSPDQPAIGLVKIAELRNPANETQHAQSAQAAHHRESIPELLFLDAEIRNLPRRIRRVWRYCNHTHEKNALKMLPPSNVTSQILEWVSWIFTYNHSGRILWRGRARFVVARTVLRQRPPLRYW